MSYVGVKEIALEREIYGENCIIFPTRAKSNFISMRVLTVYPVVLWKEACWCSGMCLDFQFDGREFESRSCVIAHYMRIIYVRINYCTAVVNILL